MLLLLNQLPLKYPKVQNMNYPLIDNITEIKKLNPIFNSNVKVIEYKKLKSEGIDIPNSGVSNYINKNGFDPFKSTFDMILNERKILIENNSTYFDGIHKCDEKNQSYTVKDIVNEIAARSIRIKRLFSLMNPRYNVVKSYSKINKKSYVVLKSFWVDDQNNYKRCFSRNAGIEGFELEEYVEKLFLLNGYTVLSSDKNQRFDFFVEKKGIQYAAEFKLDDVDQIYRLILQIEMWKKYTNIYL